MGRGRIIFLLLGLALVLGATGCGGGDSEPAAATPPPPTKKQYLEKAEDVCYRFSKKQVRQTELFRQRHGLDGAEPQQGELERIIAAVVIPVAEQKLRT